MRLFHNIPNCRSRPVSKCSSVIVAITISLLSTVAIASSTTTPSDPSPFSPQPSDQSSFPSSSSSSRPKLRLLPGGLLRSPEPPLPPSPPKDPERIVALLDGYLPRRPAEIRLDTVAHIRELNDFDYKGLDGTDGSYGMTGIEGHGLPFGFWAGSHGWEGLWEAVSRHMDDVQDVGDDKLLFEACVVDKLGYKRKNTTLQHWLAHSAMPEDRGWLKAFTILCIAEINAYNKEDLMLEEWLALLASWIY